MSSDIYFRVCHKLLLWSVFLNGWIFCSSSAFNQLYLMNKVWRQGNKGSRNPTIKSQGQSKGPPKPFGVTEADYVRPEALNTTLEWPTVKTSLLYLLMQSVCWKTWKKSERTLVTLSADISLLFIAGGLLKANCLEPGSLTDCSWAWEALLLSLLMGKLWARWLPTQT